jgi:LPS export ABC transporter protein LptC
VIHLRSLLSLLALAALSVLGLRALEQVSKQLNERKKVNPPEVDYELFELRLVRLLPNAGATIRIEADTAKHRRSSASLLIEPVSVRQLDAEEVTIVTGKQALLHEESDILNLRGNVQIQHEAPERREIFRSEKLQIDIPQQTASTQGEVVLEDGRSILRGRGLSANLVTQAFEIKHDIQLSYQPRTTSKRSDRNRETE